MKPGGGGGREFSAYFLKNENIFTRQLHEYESSPVTVQALPFCQGLFVHGFTFRQGKYFIQNLFILSNIVVYVP